MTILQQPDALSLSGNIKDFRISTPGKISFVLLQGATEILSQSYDPGQDGLVTISLKDIIHSCLSFRLQESSQVYLQPTLADTFTARFSDEYVVNPDISGDPVYTDITFRAVRAGIDRFADTATNFLTQNFLTWQPTVKPVTYYSPEFLTYYAVVPCIVKLRAYFTDDSGSVITQKDITLSDFEAGKAYTIPLQYASVAGKLDNELPGYYDVWIENTEGVRLTYIQRYYASDMLSEQEQWILFENSLGGIDTFRAYGSSDFTGEHTHNIAEIEYNSLEYRVDTERKFQKNTGHLNAQERRWLLDFFPSLSKYIYTGSYLRPIVVTESNVTYTDRELPSNYSFTYKYADARPFLNIPRTEPAGDLNITVPGVGSFTVPPRLVEFPRLPLTEGALFPVQDPYSEKWYTATSGSLSDFIAERIAKNYVGGGGIGHQHNNFNLLELLSYGEEYLLVSGKKIKSGIADEAHSFHKDTARNQISFLKGLSSEKLIEAKEGIRIGDGLIEWDPEYNILRISKSDGSPAGIAASGGVSAKGYSPGSGGGVGGASALYQLVDVIANSTGTGVEGAVDGSILKYDALAGKWKAGEAGLNENQLASYLSTNNYAKKTDIPSLAGYATEKWVTDKGYLVATASDKANWNAAYGWGNHALSGYAKQTDLKTVSDKLNSFLSGESISDTIDNWKEFQKVFENFPDSANMVELLRGKVDITTSVRAGTGLTGGGPLSKDITLSLGETGVSVGAYTKLTVDKYGRVTSGTSLIASDIPSLAISKITGLQDALNSKLNSNDFQSKFDAAIAAWFVRDEGNKGIRPAAYKGEEIGFYSNTYLSAKGRAAGSGGGGGGASALYQLLDVIPNASGTGVEGVADGYVLAYDALAGKWKAAQRLDETALKAYLTTNKYATQGWVSGQGYLTQHQSLANYVTLNTAQEITGDKTFFSSNGNLRTVINGRDIITVHNSNYVGGWTRGLIFRKADGATNYGTFGAYGSDQALNYLYIGQNYASPWITFNDTLVKSNIAFEASSIRKTGGTSTQFLKADGSIDSNSYLTTVSASSTYVRKVGDIMTGALTVPNLVISSTDGVKHIAFSRDSYNYITTPANALLAFVMNNKVTDPNNADFIITNNRIYSGGTGVVTNGTNAHRWSNVYSVLGNFSGVITAGSSINAAGTINSGANVNAENYIVTKKGWFQNDSVGGGLYNKGGDARWFYDGFQWYADKAVLSISTITGTRLVSNIANGTAPLIVSSSTMVNNLNSQYLGGYDRGRYVYHNAYSNTNGCLVRLTARATEECMITVHIIGNSYNAKNVPIDTTIQFYNYPPENKIVNPSAVHNGYNFGSIDVFNYDGQVYLWFKQTGLCQSFSIIARYTNGNGNYYGVNVVESITNAAKPTAEVTRSVTITPSVSALLTDNVASATKLANSRRIFGQLFDGTTDVSGEASGVTRVSNTSGSNLFLGNSDNTGFVQTSNMCASTGTTYWSLRTTGVGHFRRINLGDVENDDSNYRLAIAGNVYINGHIISPFYRINYNNTNPYYSLTKDSKTAYFQLYDTKAYLGFGTANSLNITQDGKVGIGIGTTNPSYNLHVGGSGYFSGSITTSGNIATGGQDGAFVRVGNVYLQYDATNNAIKVVKYDGSSANLYATGGLSAKGLAEGSGGGGGGGLIQNVYGYTDLGKTYSNADLDNTFNAYTINQLATRITSLEGGSAMTFNTTGTGEFFSAVNKNGTTVTFTKSTPNYIKSSTTEKTIKPDTTGSGLLKLYFVNGSNVGLTGGYADALFLNGYIDNSAGGTNLITFDKRNGEMGLHYQSFNSTTWGARRVVLESSNYSNYTVTKTGGGASGTWGIDITGNANSATSLRDIRTIGISGGATGTATSFNGTSNITIPVTEIDPSKSYYENEKLLIKKIVAQYTSDSSEVTGIIKISLPSGWSATMMGIEIDVYDYSRNAYSKVLVGGYNYTTQAWYNTSVSILGNHGYNVRLGYDGSKCCILLGSTTYNWHYPKVVVRNVMSAFSGYMSLNGTWNTSVITTESGLSSIVEPVVNTGMTVETARSCSGNAATATNISNTGTVTLATATESNAITITQPSYIGNQPVKLLNFNWYNDVWSIGNIRNYNATSAGLGIFEKGSEIAKFAINALHVPTLVIRSQNQVSHIKFTRPNLNYISCDTSGLIGFVTNGKDPNAANSDVIISGNMIYPGTNNLVINGTDANRWSNVYSVLGDFSGIITAGTYKSGKSMFQDGQLDLSGATPYIDFHYNNSTADYTHRIIAETADRLNITTGLQVNGILYGKGNLNIGSTIVSNVEPTGTNTWSNLSTLSPVLSMGNYSVAKDSIQPMFRWANQIPEGYISRYIIGSHRPSSVGFGQLRLWVGNNDVGTTGNWFALNNNGVVSTSTTYFETSNTGFKTGNVVFSNISSSIAEISSATNELIISGYSSMQVNDRSSGTGRAIPTSWAWRAGTVANWATFSLGSLNAYGSIYTTGNITTDGTANITRMLNANGGLTVVDLALFNDDLQVDGYSSFNSDVTINANLGMRGTIDLIGGTIRGDSSSKIICDGIGISAGNKESGCIISGNPNAWSIVLDHNDIQARNNGAWSSLYINDYGGDVSITNSSATYSAKILSTKASTAYNNGALTVGGGVGVGGSVYVRNNVVVNGAVTAKEPSTSDIRLKDNIRDFNASLILKEIGKPFTFEWNSLARELNSNLSNEHQNFGVSAQRVKEVLPGFAFECYEGGYLGVKYERFMPIVMAAQLETMGEVEILKRRVKELEDEIKILKKEV